MKNKRIGLRCLSCITMQLQWFQLECMMKLIHGNVSLDSVIQSIKMYSLYCSFEPIEMHDCTLCVGPDEPSHGWYWYEKPMYFIPLLIHGPHCPLVNVFLSLIIAELKNNLTYVYCLRNALDQSHAVVIHAKWNQRTFISAGKQRRSRGFRKIVTDVIRNLAWSNDIEHTCTGG